MSFNWNFPKYDEKWPVIAKQGKQRDGNRCTKCGSTGTKDNPLHSAHILSKSQGGQDELKNIKTLCKLCHSQEAGHGHMKAKPKNRLNLPF